MRTKKTAAALAPVGLLSEGLLFAVCPGQNFTNIIILLAADFVNPQFRQLCGESHAFFT